MKKSSFYLLLICLLALILRLPLLPVMNSYVDYDEGTYLLIARLINHGILPYRDIFAVHPPLYYYALAGWIRIFGDSYIMGRIFSLILGLFSIFIAYLVGKEVKNKNLGLLFALVLALDPLAIRINTLVLHESMVELFTVLSLLFLTKYLSTQKRKYSYFSVVTASLGTSVKFTLIPYLLAIFVFLIFYESEPLRKILLNFPNILTRNQQYVLPLAYMLWILISTSIIVIWPREIARIILIVPGIHPIAKIGNIYGCVLFLFFWIFLTVYILNIRYLSSFKMLLKGLSNVFSYIIILSLIVIFSKALVEIPLGIMVSRNYVNQTYFAQGTRGFPFVGIFWVLNNVLTYIQKSSLELLVYYLPLFSLIILWIPFKALGTKLLFSKPLGALALLNGIFYLIVAPIIPNPRFIYPLLLVLYIYLLSGEITLKTGDVWKKFLGILISIVLLVALIDAGVIYNYPKGLLRISCAPHTKELREDLLSYIHQENLNGTYLSINPMDAYYLRLTVVPFMVDTFGLGYLEKYNLVDLVREYSPDYVIYDTWMFNMMKNKPLQRVYGPLFNYTLQNGTLLFEESLKDGEIIALFSFRTPPYPWRVDLYGTSLQVYYSIARINVNFNPSPGFLKLVKEDNGYELLIVSHNRTFEGRITLGNNSMSIAFPYNVTLTITSPGVILHNKTPVRNGIFDNVILCTSESCFLLSGKIKVFHDKLTAEGSIQLKVLKRL